MKRRGRFEDDVNARLEEEYRDLERLKRRRLERLRRDVERSAQTELFKRAREEKGQREIDRDIGDTVSRWSDEAKAAGGASAGARPPRSTSVSTTAAICRPS